MAYDKLKRPRPKGGKIRLHSHLAVGLYIYIYIYIYYEIWMNIQFAAIDNYHISQGRKSANQSAGSIFDKDIT